MSKYSLYWSNIECCFEICSTTGTFIEFHYDDNGTPHCISTRKNLTVETLRELYKTKLTAGYTRNSACLPAHTSLF